MKKNISWLFFDVGSTLIDEQFAYKHRLQDIAEAANTTYNKVYDTAMEFYRQNKKGDLETAKQFGFPLPKWHTEDEILYPDAASCLKTLSRKYKIGIIANQELGTKDRLQQQGILQYIDLVIASAEEGIAKPDEKIFKIALQRAACKSDNAIMIGDRIDNDIIPAKKLGFHTIWIKQGFGQYWNITKEEETPDYTVCTLSKLCDIL